MNERRGRDREGYFWGKQQRIFRGFNEATKIWLATYYCFIVFDQPFWNILQPNVIRDPWCDPEHPIVLKFEDVSAAAYRIKDGIIMTPCDASHMNSDLGLEMYFKKDYMQFTGSFKERGAR